MSIDRTKPRVLLRADGNNQIGLGHIYRCLAIAERIGEKFDCFFVIRKVTPELHKKISAFATVITLNEHETYVAEAYDIVTTVIKQYQIDYVVLDGYYFDTPYQSCIKQNSTCVLISIDDDQPFHYVADKVINHSAGVKPEDISKEPYTQTFLGYNFLLLRKQFITLLKSRRKVRNIESVLICFGGADPDNFTCTILQFVNDIKSISNIVVVTGSSYSHSDKLNDLAAQSNNITIMSDLDAKSMATLMCKMDVAILPASTIALEALAAKMILITGITADNQKNNYNSLINQETVVGVDDFKDLTYDKLFNIIQSIFVKFKDQTFIPQTNITDSLLRVFKKN